MKVLREVEADVELETEVGRKWSVKLKRSLELKRSRRNITAARDKATLSLHWHRQM